MLYHKINSIFKRDEKGKFILGEWSLPEYEYLQNNQWVWTEKVDGTNTRILWDGKKITLGGRTENAQIPSPLITALQNLFVGEQLASLFPAQEKDTTICFFGEGYGPKIQSGGKYRSDTGFVLFDVKIGDWYLKRKDVEDIAKQLDLEIVPVVGQGTINEAIEFVKNGFLSNWGDFISEGLVIRPQVELKTRAGERVITKIKHVDFINF